MKETQILMSTPMVRATLANLKTQTRRIVNPQPTLAHPWYGCLDGTQFWTDSITQGEKGQMEFRCPRCDRGISFPFSRPSLLNGQENIPPMETDLIKKPSAAQLVEAWEQANAIMDAAYAELDRAKAIFNSAFGNQYGGVMDVLPRYNDSVEKMKAENKKRAWRQVVDLLEIKKVMSLKRIDEMDKSLEEGKMPDITLENILQISQGMVNSAPAYAQEAVIEVFDFLRPGAKDGNNYKTNQKHARFELGKKVIITNAVEFWSRGCFHISHWRMDKIRAVDRVFHLADGAGELKGYNGPLVDAIQASESGAGETAYFRFHVYSNGNLHLEFKRPDLVTKLNAVAGNPTHLKGK